MAELTGQSSSIKPGEVAQVNTPRELCSEHPKGTNEKASRVTGVSSNGEFWILHVLDTIRKLEGMPKNVHVAFPIDIEDESGNKPIDKAREALTRLKTVCQTLATDITLVAHYICRWITLTNTPSGVLSYYWPEPPCSIIASQVKRVRVRARMGWTRSM